MNNSNLTEPWYRQAILYHLYPLSFADSNADGFGDLRGIIDHLDYLNDGTAESLGVTALWLSPIYASPMADFGYDVANFEIINPLFGTLADFDELLARAHERGMRLIMDFVPNHTSIEHAWFKDARVSRSSDKRDFYIWADPAADGGPPNNWLSRFGGPAWSLDAASGQYYLHTFLPEQPDLNWRNPLVREAMLSVLRFWLGRGVDGFRTDSATSLLKDEQLRDNPPNPAYVPGVSHPADRFLQVFSAVEDEVGKIIGSFCEVLAEAGNDRFLVTEAYLGISGMSKLYHACDAHPVHAPFNFNLMTLPWDAAAYRSFIDEYEASLRPEDWPNYVLGNHDHQRLASRVEPLQARLAAMLQLTLRGLPVVYYGDELGLPDADVAKDQLRDPVSRLLPGLGLGRDPERSPMPWDTTVGYGFSLAKPWLPFVRGAAEYSVAVQERQPDSTWQLYRHLIHLRQTMPALNDGDYRSLDAGCPQIFAFMREIGSHRVCVVLNFSADPMTANLGKVGAWIAGTVTVDGDGEDFDGGELNLAGFEGRVYELRRGADL
jgi:alpha-glucosidase